MIRKLRLWGKNFGNKHKWFAFVISIAFVSLALFRIGVNDRWNYVMIVPLVVLGILVVITYPDKGKKNE